MPIPSLASVLSELDVQFQEALTALSAIDNLPALDVFKSLYLGKKSPLSTAMRHLGSLPPEEKPSVGQKLNDLKSSLQEAIQNQLKIIKETMAQRMIEADTTDASLPPRGSRKGSFHPIHQTQSQIMACLSRLGFSVKEGPDIETEFYNFEALHIPANHSARDMHDTFYLHSGLLLRTHTSPVQIRTMQQQAPPIKIMVPGKVYRCDSDATHSPCFHQIEGLVVDKGIRFSDLKGVLIAFLEDLLGQEVKIRFRPSYFPFTEPSTEIDVSCFKCHGSGCGLCKQTGWIEVLGAGLVNRHVLRASGYDPETVTGFAFGIGVDRMAMLQFGIPDIRLLYENDSRFLRQF